MARKRAHAKAINPAAANSGVGDGPLSPSSTGAMDSLLEKLRAAAPQARDQRDRRRRARLRDRHQVRVASGQTMPDLGDLTKTSESDDADPEGDSKNTPNGTPTGISHASEDGDTRMEPISEGEDVADRAASMLQGLRGDDGEPSNQGGPSSRDGGSLRVRRRRESADDERRNRRRRRAKEGSTQPSSNANGEPTKGEDISRPRTSEGFVFQSAPIPEEGDDNDDEANATIITDKSHNDGDPVPGDELDTTPHAPRTTISPPSPE